MKIRTKKKMRLDELIKYVFDNGITGKRFEERLDYKSYSITHAVHVTGNGVMNVEGLFNPDTKFTVEVEEELTEETELCDVTTLIKKPQGILPVYTTSSSIRECLDSLTGDDIEPLKIFNGITEIWSKDTGIPESGVLEVSE